MEFNDRQPLFHSHLTTVASPFLFAVASKRLLKQLLSLQTQGPSEGLVGFYLPAPRNAFAQSLLCLCKCSRSGLRVSLTNSSKKQQNLQHNEVFSRIGSGISIRVATEFKSSNFHSLTSFNTLQSVHARAHTHTLIRKDNKWI